MNDFKVILLLIITTQWIQINHTHAKQSTNPAIHYIGTWYGGFFASFNCVLNHLNWCEQNNKVPVVYWDKRSLYYVPSGFNKTHNVWKYYFKPVSPIKYKRPHRLPLIFSPGSINFCGDYIDQETRNKAHYLISKYIRVRSATRNKIEQFYQKYMAGKTTIGIHLRGTDKVMECKLVEAQRIIQAALQHASPDAQFLIASDDQKLLDEMKGLLCGRNVLYYPCYRTNNGTPLHHNVSAPQKPSLAQLGEDVLVEVSLLAQCNILIHTASNVSTAALYFNPGLEHIMLS